MKADGGGEGGVSVMGRFGLCFLGDRNLCRVGSFLVTCLYVKSIWVGWKC